jgi:D-aminopeptidase
VIATDAPLLSTQCRRLAVRAGIGIANTGSVGDNGSGDIYLAFSTANQIRQDTEVDFDVSKSIPDNDDMNIFFHAVSEAFQEAAHNAACMARTMVGATTTIYELPLDRLVQIVQDHDLYGGGFPG